jgi:hypothetical protein
VADDKVLDRIGKLMRLALNNPNREEAASAALKAIALMDEHKVQFATGAVEHAAYEERLQRFWSSEQGWRVNAYFSQKRQADAMRNDPFTRPGRGVE